MTSRLLLISGSLRAASTNRAALRTAARVVPAGVTAALYDGLAGLPHFNPDDDTDDPADSLPPPVAALRHAIRAADALLFCAPEYAGALPGSFKNLLDWTIGDAEPRSIYRKPVAWLNVSPRGAEAAHRELRAVLGYAHADIVEQACAHVPVSSGDLDADGLVPPGPARDRIAATVAVLARRSSSD